MLGIKTALIGGVLTIAAFSQSPILNGLQRNPSLPSPVMINEQIKELRIDGTQTIYHKNGQIKEEVLFDDGNFKIFRTFDEEGKQIFNQDDGLKCIESK